MKIIGTAGYAFLLTALVLSAGCKTVVLTQFSPYPITVTSINNVTQTATQTQTTTEIQTRVTTQNYTDTVTLTNTRTVITTFTPTPVAPLPSDGIQRFTALELKNVWQTNSIAFAALYSGKTVQVVGPIAYFTTSGGTGLGIPVGAPVQGYIECFFDSGAPLLGLAANQVVIVQGKIAGVNGYNISMISCSIVAS